MSHTAKICAVVWVGLLFVLAYPTATTAGVLVFDDVTTVGHPLFLRVLTKGRIFPQGGRRFTLRVDNQPAVNGLTGGDGYGYVRHNPLAAGIETVTATSDAVSGTGSILVLEPTARTLFVDMEVLMKRGVRLAEREADGSEALQTLSKTHAVIYLAGFFEMFAAKKWISLGRFPQSVVLRKSGLQTFEQLRERGVPLYAIIGPKTLISEVAEDFEHRLTFDQAGADVTVSDWQEVLERLEGPTE